jgi:hypothetical protein
MPTTLVAPGLKENEMSTRAVSRVYCAMNNAELKQAIRRLECYDCRADVLGSIIGITNAHGYYEIIPATMAAVEEYLSAGESDTTRESLREIGGFIAAM